METTQIAIEIFKQMFNEEQINKLIKGLLDENGFNNQLAFPPNFPVEIENPVIIDGYGNHDIQEEENQEEVIILGSYTLMNSSGVITFYMDNIKKYSGSLIRKVVNSGISLGFDTALFTINFVVIDIMYHESFHYYCDYKRQLTKATFNRDKEEAFAVAHSYQENSPETHVYSTLMFHNEYAAFFLNYVNAPNRTLVERRFRKIFDFLRKEHYRGFTSKGYKDWHLYKDRNSYKTHIFDYLKDSTLDRLLTKGVPVNKIQSEILDIKNEGTRIRLMNKENTFQEIKDPNRASKKVGFEMVAGKEPTKVTETLDTLNDAISHDRPITESNLNDLTTAIQGLSIDVGGISMSVREAENIPGFKRNMEIFKEIQGGNVSNHGQLTFITPLIAASLSKHKGDLDLDGLTTLSDAAAEFLSEHKGDLWLNSLTTLSDAAAESMSKHEGRLDLDGLTTLSDAAAEYLSKHEGTLYLSRLTTLSDAAAESLSKHKNIDVSSAIHKRIHTFKK